MEIAPLDVLIVDEAAQVRECELVIPLRLHWVKHVVLVGDDCQLSSMVKNKVRFCLLCTVLFHLLVIGAFINKIKFW
jgi:superfamily I DNA and/or RNA helicase